MNSWNAEKSKASHSPIPGTRKKLKKNWKNLTDSKRSHSDISTRKAPLPPASCCRNIKFIMRGATCPWWAWEAWPLCRNIVSAVLCGKFSTLLSAGCGIKARCSPRYIRFPTPTVPAFYSISNPCPSPFPIPMHLPSADVPAGPGPFSP